MEKIASFCINHNILNEGMYTSRVDGDVVTYDIRMVKPNGGAYLENAAMHTFEHLFATFARNSAYSAQVVYVGPMGCRTGFYLLVRDAVSPAQAVALVQQSCAFIAAYEGAIPGTTAIECGNYREHDLTGARAVAAKMCTILRDWMPAQLVYPA